MENASISNAIAGLTRDVADFKTAHRAELDAMREQLDRHARKTARTLLGGGSSDRDPRDEAARKAFGQYLRTGNAALLAEHVKGMSIGTPSDGGNAVPLVIDNEVQIQLRNANPLRGLANVVVSASGNYRRLLMQNNATSSWVSEAAARPATTSPKIQGATPPVGELYGNVAISQQLLDDAQFDIATEVTGEIARVFADAETAAFVSGTGSDQPRGFLSGVINTQADGTRAFGAVKYLPTGAAATLPTTTAGLVDLLNDVYFDLRSAYRANSTWLMNSATAAVISKAKDGQGMPLWAQGIAGGAPGTLLGRPVVIVDSMPAIAANAYPIALADWSRAYTIVDRVGISTLIDPYSARPDLLMYARKRVGGGIVDDNAIRLVKVATT